MRKLTESKLLLMVFAVVMVSLLSFITAVTLYNSIEKSLTGNAVANAGAVVSITQVDLALQGIGFVISVNSLLMIIITSLIIYQLLTIVLLNFERDYLTGLKSKGYQDLFLSRLIKKSIKKDVSFSLIMIDFDDFKFINDKYGHQFGDLVLKSVSGIIKTDARTVDCCARYGGDELVIILPGADVDYATYKCQWLLKEVSHLELSSNKDATVHVSISIGIALWGKGMDSEQILARADKALYQSKRTGKGKIAIYNDDLE